jgi:hypothetical protein
VKLAAFSSRVAGVEQVATLRVVANANPVTLKSRAPEEACA